MAKIKRIELLQKRLFQIFVFLIPSQLALHFWPKWSFVFGIRVDYLSPAIYTTDILALLFLFSLILSNTNKKIKVNTSMVAVFMFALINTALAVIPQLAFYKWVKIFVYLLFFYFAQGLKSYKSKEWFLKPLEVSLVFYSLIAIGQFIKQETLGGVFYWLGERSFNASTPGIALTEFFGGLKLRSYSTFPHPNALAGYFVVSLILLYFSKKKLKKFDYIVVLLSLSAILMAQSLNAFITLGLFFFLYLFNKREHKFKNYFFYFFVVLTIVISIGFPFLRESDDKTLATQIQKRLVLSKGAAELFSRRPIVGVGMNNFIPLLPTTSLKTAYSWDLQPAHNTTLFLLSETGVVGLLIFYLVIQRGIRSGSVNTQMALLAILFSGIADHYWLTLQQNFILFTFVLTAILKDKISNT
jgi:hypothetical protein